MTTDAVDQITRAEPSRPVWLQCGLFAAIGGAAGLAYGIGWQVIIDSGCDDDFLECLGPAVIGMAIATVVLPLATWTALRLLKVPYAFGTVVLISMLAVFGYGFGPTPHVIVELGVAWYLALYAAVIAGFVGLVISARTTRLRLIALACAALVSVGYVWWGNTATDQWTIDQYRDVAPSWWTSTVGSPGTELEFAL